MEPTIVLGGNKKARRAYGFDEVALVPAAISVDPYDVDTSWKLASLEFKIPIVAAALDAAVNAKVAAEMTRLGGFAVLNLDGLQTRYDDAEAIMNEIAAAPSQGIIELFQKLYTAPIKETLVAKRVEELKKAGAIAAVASVQASAPRLSAVAAEAGADLYVIQSTIMALDHSSSRYEPVDVADFVKKAPLPVILGNTVGYSSSYELMEAGAVAVLVGVGPGAICTSRKVLGIGVPQVTAIADVSAARDAFLAKTGRYIPVIADGGMRTGGDISKAIACGADAVMLGTSIAACQEAPAPGYSWGMASSSADLPRGTRVQTGVWGKLEEILLGPAHRDDGTMNLIGALKLSMSCCGSRNLAQMHNAELIVAPALATEGKHLQYAQHVGQGR